MELDDEIKNLAAIRIARRRGESKLMLVGGVRLPDEIAELRTAEHIDIIGDPATVLERVGDFPALRSVRILSRRYDRGLLEDLPTGVDLQLAVSVYAGLQGTLDPHRIIGLSVERDEELRQEMLELPNLRRLVIEGALRPEFERAEGLHSLSLDLDYEPPGAIPNLLVAFPQLKSLWLRTSWEADAPEWLAAPHQLEELGLSGVRLPTMPGVPFLPPGLHSLSLIDADLTEVPRAIGDLADLRVLNLSQNPIAALPAYLTQMRELRSLWLAACALETLPDSVARLDRLERLSLHGNPIDSLLPSFAQLQALVTLILSGTQLEQIPSSVFELSQLIYLDVGIPRYVKRTGKLLAIPADILRLEHLVALELHGQPIEHPPPEVVAKGLPAIQEYHRQLQREGFDYLCEAKLLVVGEPGAGKTSLTHKFRDPRYVLRDDQPSTEGIEVASWRFPTELTIGDAGRTSRVQRELTVHLWDFGGQEIYHATHQFFLTKRSLYVLVADSRAEDTDFHYWLQVVELLSEGSPLLIVQNEKQDRRRELDEDKLRGRFANLRGVLRVNLETNRGLEALERAVRRELQALPHIGTRLPRTWNRVREALKQDPRNHISLEQFFAICGAHGFARDEDKLQLGGYLHDLGVCLHFHDDPVLKHTVILKPEWGTDAVYRVLDDRGVIERHGRFERKHLAAIWSDSRYAAMQDELLRLMMKFKLCYEIAETGSFIAPQLLRATRPDYEWVNQNNLVIEYRYEFMPKGMLTRLIVALHGLIESHDSVWRNGVVLARDGARAQVVEDHVQRVIKLRVAGTNRRDLASIVDWELERILASFLRLKYTRHIPCTCKRCEGQEQPQLHDYETVQRFARAGQLIQCQKNIVMVDARQLMGNAFSGERGNAQTGFDEIPASPAAPNLAPRKEVFVSYAWGGESEQVVDAIVQALDARGIAVVRDKSVMRYKDSIRAFMQRMGQGKAVVVVLSQHYLESHNCMFELAELADAGDFAERVFPIILADAGVFEATRRVAYVRHWESKKAALDLEMKTVGQDNLQGIRDEIDLYVRIRATIARLIDILANMNTLDPEQHRRSGFGALYQQLEAKLT